MSDAESDHASLADIYKNCYNYWCRCAMLICSATAASMMLLSFKTPTSVAFCASNTQKDYTANKVAWQEPITTKPPCEKSANYLCGICYCMV